MNQIRSYTVNDLSCLPNYFDIIKQTQSLCPLIEVNEFKPMRFDFIGKLTIILIGQNSNIIALLFSHFCQTQSVRQKIVIIRN